MAIPEGRFAIREGWVAIREGGKAREMGAPGRLGAPVRDREGVSRPGRGSGGTLLSRHETERGGGWAGGDHRRRRRGALLRAAAPGEGHPLRGSGGVRRSGWAGADGQGGRVPPRPRVPGAADSLSGGPAAPRL